jgi:hypothetical protein
MSDIKETVTVKTEPVSASGPVSVESSVKKRKRKQKNSSKVRDPAKNGWLKFYRVWYSINGKKTPKPITNATKMAATVYRDMSDDEKKTLKTMDSAQIFEKYFKQ